MRPVPTLSALTAFLISLLLLTTPVRALKQPTSYCKCICFQNSTIIPLNSPPSESQSSHPSSSSSPKNFPASRDDEEKKDQSQKHHTLTCNDCNRAFCLDYNLPICKNAKEEDVFAQCFQRDSLKDRTIVTLFILATASLLGWALVKPLVVKSGVGDVVQRYTPVGRRSGLSVSSDDAGLPGPNGRSVPASGGGDGGGNGRSGRAGGGRGSISRQGGLNS